MKILVAKSLAPRWVDAGLGDSVLYRPQLEALPSAQLAQVLREHPVDAVIATSGQAATLQGHAKNHNAPHWVSCKSHGAVPDAVADLDALGAAERRIQEDTVRRRLDCLGLGPPEATAGSLQDVQVSLVGAGIVNLINTLELVEHGARLEVYDAGPDPRAKPPWQRLGTTHGGGDARMFCFTEAGNYNEKLDPVGGKIPGVLRRTIQDDGWLAVAPGEFTRSERRWIARFLSLPTWKAEVFTEDIHRFTAQAASLWASRQERQPHLFDDVGLSHGVLALYAEESKAQSAEALHQRLGSLLRSMGPGELAHRHPACHPAVRQGAIVRGLEIRGFTLNIHRFVGRLLEHLEERGVRFHWNHPVHGLDWTPDGRVGGLQTPHGTVRSDHYVLSPGLAAGPLLRGTRSAGALQGMLGLWLHLPHPEPCFRHSIKLHREGNVGEDANIILGRDSAGRSSLILGSGYGFLGQQQLDMGSPQVARLFEALEDTARRFFPNAYTAAQRDGSLQHQRKACVRPFSATGLGLFEVLNTDRGGRVILAGGHNTGGFAQAPVVAQAVADTLRGRSHPMQVLYDPQRGLPRSSSAPEAAEATENAVRHAEDDPAMLQLAGS